MTISFINNNQISLFIIFTNNYIMLPSTAIVSGGKETNCMTFSLKCSNYPVNNWQCLVKWKDQECASTRYKSNFSPNLSNMTSILLLFNKKRAFNAFSTKPHTQGEETPIDRYIQMNALEKWRTLYYDLDAIQCQDSNRKTLIFQLSHVNHWL